jgi:Zn-dependent protease/predicted transcriptional regulator
VYGDQPHGWSWHLGSLFGIEVRVHGTFLLLLAWVALGHLLHGQNLAAALGGVAYVLAVFGTIVLHELGHALTARRFGIATRDITLLPIGGVARLERMPTKPSEELLVAVAGPLVNVALAVLFLAMLVATGATGALGRPDMENGSFLAKMMWTNVGLAAFNLIPAFPMDGGRVLRALVALRAGYLRATDIAAVVGRTLALLFGLVGLLSNPFLVFIAVFVWAGADEEARMAHVHASLGGVPVSRAMVTGAVVVTPDQPVLAVARHMLDGFQGDFPVIDDGALVGVLGRTEILRAALGGDPNVRVSSVMARAVPTVEETDSLETGLERLQASGRPTIPVVRNGLVVGMLPVENVAYILQLRERTNAPASAVGARS